MAPESYNSQPPSLSFAPGTRIGPYEILAPLGAGGMDGVTTAVAWISVGGLIFGLIAAHLMFARKLMDVDRQERPE